MCSIHIEGFNGQGPSTQSMKKLSLDVLRLASTITDPERSSADAPPEREAMARIDAADRPVRGSTVSWTLILKKVRNQAI